MQVKLINLISFRLSQVFVTCCFVLFFTQYTSSKTHKIRKWTRTRLRSQAVNHRTNYEGKCQSARILKFLPLLSKNLQGLWQRTFFFLSSLEYSDNRWLGVDFVSCLPNHKFPVRVDSKKALAVVGEFQAKKELKWHIYVSQFATICHLAKLHKIQSLCVC